MPLQQLLALTLRLSTPKRHEFKVAAIAAWDLLKVVESVREEDDVSLDQVRALLLTTATT